MMKKEKKLNPILSVKQDILIQKSLKKTTALKSKIKVDLTLLPTF